MSRPEAHAQPAPGAERECAGCVHWHALNGGVGECRCNPPTVCQREPVPYGDVPVRPWFFGQYPVTRRDDWCGAFVRREWS